MIELHGQISMAFLKKSRFTGSYQGMRYLLQKAERTKEQGSQEQEDKTETVLEAVIWPEPFHYEKSIKRIFRFMRTGFGRQWDG